MPKDYAARAAFMQWLKGLRKHNHYTQGDLGDQLDCGLATVTHWEQGLRYPGPKYRALLRKLADDTGFVPPPFAN